MLTAATDTKKKGYYMDRNTSNHFSINPVNIDISRSRWNNSFGHKTTFNTGFLIPHYVREVLPGDTWSLTEKGVVRMSTPIHPVFDTAFQDTYYFFVPNRLTWEHWKNFQGQNDTSAWADAVDYCIPQITAPAGGWNPLTLADYMGLPTKVENISVSALKFRAYALIVNTWFRDQNLKDPCMINFDDATQAGSNGGNYITDIQNGGIPFKVAKVHDYFTSCLPSPQKGPDVLLPLGNLKGEIPVVGTGMTTGWIAGDGTLPFGMTATGGNGVVIGTNTYGQPIGSSNGGGPHADNRSIGLTQDPEKSGIVAIVNNLQNGATTINQLRQAFAIQRAYEKDARGGTRYFEHLKAVFGVTSPDSTQQIPEYLGGTRCYINVDQVLQTSSTDSTSPQGNTAAYSLSSYSNDAFTKSFTEHGYIIGVTAIRTLHTYQQGINRDWSRKTRFDFYEPTFANIGEQAVLNKEIYATGTSTDDEVFGYQEAWADYRYFPSYVTGAMRSNYDTTLDSWHYADNYVSLPTLSSEWIDETTENLDRTLAVSSKLEPQFIADFWFDETLSRAMPLYSIPGLIDHH